jgi:hypothetical protein
VNLEIFHPGGSLGYYPPTHIKGEAHSVLIRSLSCLVPLSELQVPAGQRWILLPAWLTRNEYNPRLLIDAGRERGWRALEFDGHSVTLWSKDESRVVRFENFRGVREFDGQWGDWNRIGHHRSNVAGAIVHCISSERRLQDVPLRDDGDSPITYLDTAFSSNFALDWALIRKLACRLGYDVIGESPALGLTLRCSSSARLVRVVGGIGVFESVFVPRARQLRSGAWLDQVWWSPVGATGKFAKIFQTPAEISRRLAAVSDFSVGCMASGS